MSIGNTTEGDILKLIFQAVAWANYANNGTTPETNIAVALHSADPGEAGTQASSEAAYTSYTRKLVLRDATNWPLTVPAATQVAPSANIDFVAGTGGGESVTFFSVGKASVTHPSAAQILFSGAVSPAITTGSGITPRLTTATKIELD